ncbi:MAG TPA: phosphatidylserine decarboxylase [Acidobacteriota bacterium]|nr:phosphatidylserine decarboxylase [Acidobacteriota bacterium]
MVRDGFYFNIPVLALMGVGIWLGLWVWVAVLVLVGGFILFFFRNPDREIPADPSVLVSPADGKVVQIEEEGDDRLRVSIFLSVFDVHVNRAPIGGRIVQQDYHPGRFRLAFDERASVENERLVLTIEDEQRRRLTFALITGLIARRIVPWKVAGESVAKGDRIGLIRFGSRVDVFLPRDCHLEVRRGDRVAGGSSVLARWS